MAVKFTVRQLAACKDHDAVVWQFIADHEPPEADKKAQEKWKAVQSAMSGISRVLAELFGAEITVKS